MGTVDVITTGEQRNKGSDAGFGNVLLAIRDRVVQPLRHADEDLVAALAARDAARDFGVALGDIGCRLPTLVACPGTALAALLRAGDGVRGRGCKES